MAKKHYSTKMPRGPIMNALGATAKECKRKATISAIEGTHELIFGVKPKRTWRYK